MRHQVVHNRGHGFPKDLTLQGCTTLPTRANRLLLPELLVLFLGGRQRVEGYTLFMRKSIHDSSGRATGDTNPSGSPNSGTYSCFNSIRTISNEPSNPHPNGNIELEAPWIDVHTLVVLYGLPILTNVWFVRSVLARSREQQVLGSARQN